MGYSRAAEMIQNLGVRGAIIDHLEYNCFPSISRCWLETALWAIKSTVEFDWLDMAPDSAPSVGIVLAGEERTCIQMVEGLKLSAFVNYLLEGSR